MYVGWWFLENLPLAIVIVMLLTHSVGENTGKDEVKFCNLKNDRIPTLSKWKISPHLTFFVIDITNGCIIV